jgi:hypothetical protein
VRALVLEGLADATLADELGETAKSLAVEKQHMEAAVAIDCCRTARTLIQVCDDDDKPIWVVGVLSGVQDVELYNRGHTPVTEVSLTTSMGGVT